MTELWPLFDLKFCCPFDNSWKDEQILFIFGRQVHNNKMQAKFDFGYNPPIFGRVMGPFRLKIQQNVDVRSITLERMNGFNLFLVDRYIIIKCRLSSILVTIHWFLAELWALSNLKFCCPFNNSWKDEQIKFIFGRQVHNNKMQAKVDFGYNQPIFGRVIAPFWLKIQ